MFESTLPSSPTPDQQSYEAALRISLMCSLSGGRSFCTTHQTSLGSTPKYSWIKMFPIAMTCRHATAEASCLVSSGDPDGFPDRFRGDARPHLGSSDPPESPPPRDLWCIRRLQRYSPRWWWRKIVGSLFIEWGLGPAQCTVSGADELPHT